MQIRVTTIIFGLPSGQRTMQTQLTLTTVTLTLDALIAHKIRQEILEWKARKRPGLSGEYLSPEELIRANGPEALVPGAIDTEINRAQQAFAAREFMIVVDNQRRDDPQDVVVLQADTRVEFIKILPLVGG